MVVGGEDGVIRLYELSPSGVPVSNTPQVKIELIFNCHKPQGQCFCDFQ